MLGKQWLNFHIEVSLVNRSRHRELRMRGMITEYLPLVMRVSLLLGYASARYQSDRLCCNRHLHRFRCPLLSVHCVYRDSLEDMPAVSLVLRHIIPLAGNYQHCRLQRIRDQLSWMVRLRKLNEPLITATLERSIDEKLVPEPQACGTP